MRRRSTLPPGTLLVVLPTPVADIRVGDVVTYQIESGQPSVVSHRVVGTTSSSDGSRTWLLPAVAGLLLTYGAVMITIGIVSAARRRAARTRHHRVRRAHGAHRATLR